MPAHEPAGDAARAARSSPRPRKSQPKPGEKQQQKTAAEKPLVPPIQNPAVRCFGGIPSASPTAREGDIAKFEVPTAIGF